MKPAIAANMKRMARPFSPELALVVAGDDIGGVFR
jgi:hypothetical protein